MAKGLCRRHYERRRRGQPLDGATRAYDSQRGCQVDGCDGKHAESGYCAFHGQRARKGVPLDAPKRQQMSKADNPVCAREGCDRPTEAAGLCQTHYRRQREQRAREESADGGERSCSVIDCQRPRHTRGYCGIHAYRAERGLDLTAPIKSYEPRVKRPVGSEYHRDNDGYVREKALDGRWIMQHRLRMEERLGRPLLSHESVHHRNGDRKDNALENLELWSSSHPSGQRVEDKVAWAIELLKLYRPDALA
jgi:hypothetical protein